MGAKDAMAELNKSFGAGTVWGPGETQALGLEFISTGLLSLDLISGGGYPKGRIIEIYGPEASGKSTLALMGCAEAQKLGIQVAYIDMEHALDLGLADIMGVDTNNWYVSQPNSGEQCGSIVEALIASGEIGFAVVDSVAAMVPQAELEGEVGDATMGAQARMMGQIIRKLTPLVSRTKTAVIFINQLRMKIGVMYGNPETTPGGNALKYAASVRFDVRRGTPIKDKDQVIGATTRCKVIKTKQAPSYKSVEFPLIYGHRPDPMFDLVTVALEKKVLTQAGPYIKLDGESIGQGVAKAAARIKETPELHERILTAVKGAKGCH